MLLLFSVKVSELPPVWERAVHSVYYAYLSCVSVYQFVRVFLSISIFEVGFWICLY